MIVFRSILWWFAVTWKKLSITLDKHLLDCKVNHTAFCAEESSTLVAEIEIS